jgi:hypothetical protein
MKILERNGSDLQRRLSISFTAVLALILNLYNSSQSAATTNGVVTTIYTDFGGFWNSATSNDVPNNDHNLLGFTSDGVVYSTGVNDAELTSRGVSFTATTWESLPVEGLSASTSSNYYVAVGSASTYRTGAITSADLTTLLTDGGSGLNLATGVTNIPIGTAVTFQIPNGLNSSAINDGKPDILITQIANPSPSAFDKLSFKNSTNTILGNEISIDQNSISPVTRPTGLKSMSVNYFVIPDRTAGPTAVTNDLRIKTYDFSDFGLTASDLSNVTKLVWTAGGASDIAFFAYNTSSFSAFSSSTTTGTTSTTLNSIPDTDLSAGTVTAYATNTATPTATLTVGFSSSTTSVCTVNSSTGVVTLLTAGTCTITATQARQTVSSTVYPASSATRSFNVLNSSGTGPQNSGSGGTSPSGETTSTLADTGINLQQWALLAVLLVASGAGLVKKFSR